MKTIAFLLCFLFYGNAFAFGNEDVIKLLSAGFTEEMVIKAISAANPVAFDTSADGLIGLKKAGASDAVIQKILSSAQTENKPLSQAITSAPTAVPMNGGSCKMEFPDMENMVPLRAGDKVIPLAYQTAEVMSESSGGSIIASYLTLGIVKAKGNASLRIEGEKALVRITEKTPEFLDILFPAGASPGNNMALVRMTVQEKSRVVQVMSFESGLTGSRGRSMNFGENVSIPLLAEKRIDNCLWQGKRWALYRMKPAAPLENGEYGLTSGKIIYDFGVD